MRSPQLLLVVVSLLVTISQFSSPSSAARSIPCGYVSSGNRIKGGPITEIDEFPWTALLFYGEGDSATPQCNGVLISQSFVVTTARCLIDGANQKKNLTFVRLGEYDLASNPDCIKNGDAEYQCYSTQVDVNPKNTIIHPEFESNAANQHHDIALIELEQPVKYTYFIQLICLPRPTSEIPAERPFTKSGWGLTDRFRNQGLPKIFSPIKLKEDLPLLDREQCRDIYSSEMTLGSGQLCVGGESNKDTCQRSPGSPLMAIVDTEHRSMWVLVGLSSFESPECGRQPGVYTNVKQYVDWIEEHATDLTRG